MIKQIVAGLAVLLLSGCVYYVPYEASATEPWTDESVAYEEPGVVYDGYVVSPYYPWASVDYFYLGNNYYRPYSGVYYSFGFYGGPGWYPYYYDPFYYSAWYQPFYGFPYPYYGAGYGWGYGYSYWGHHNSHHGGGDWGDHDGDHNGGNGGGFGGHGGGNHGEGSNNGNYGNPRTGGHSSLDRHVEMRREPGQFDRSRSTTPSAGGRNDGMTVVNRGDNKMQPNRLQPVGNKNYRGGTRPVAPNDHSGVAIPNGQVRNVQPGPNNTAPARAPVPAGMSRPVPAENTGGKQIVVQQPPSEPVRQSQSAPTFNQQMAPQPARPTPAAGPSSRPDGGYQRGPRGTDNDDQ